MPRAQILGRTGTVAPLTGRGAIAPTATGPGTTGLGAAPSTGAAGTTGLGRTLGKTTPGDAATSMRGRLAALGLSSQEGLSGARGATVGPVGVVHGTGAGATAGAGVTGILGVAAAKFGGIAFGFGGTTVPLTTGFSASFSSASSLPSPFSTALKSGLGGSFRMGVRTNWPGIPGIGGSVDSSSSGASGAPASSRCA